MQASDALSQALLMSSNCFRVTLEMVPAVAEESDDQKWYADPECEDQKQYEYDNRHPHKPLALALNDEVLLASLLDDVTDPCKNSSICSPKVFFLQDCS